MCSADHLDVVGLVELGHHVGPEQVAGKRQHNEHSVKKHNDPPPNLKPHSKSYCLV